MKQTLLIELGAEELPPKALHRLGSAFADSIRAALIEAGLTTENEQENTELLATPRRLAVRIAAVANQAPDQNIDKLGPAVDKAYDSNGEPTPAAQGFARSCGVAVSALEHRQTEKGERLAYQGTEPGRELKEILPEIVSTALKNLPIPKRMRWGDSQASFVRPVHWLVALHGKEVVDFEVYSCRSGRVTYGHRFHCGAAIEIDHADNYTTLLEKFGYVIADFYTRRTSVRRQVEATAQTHDGVALIEDELLDEVTALVEWPVALAGAFDKRFLVLPREALIATMQGHQRYFPVAEQGNSTDATLLPCFITVANIESKDPAQVIAGNERVVRPRLSDALFFFETDCRRGLDAYLNELPSVSFQRELGSVADKSARVASLAGSLAEALSIPLAPVVRAAALAKADLLSEMVGEFPELQGTMGRYYALHAGEPQDVAHALEEQYAPRYAGAPLPQSPTGQVLALADKFDTLAGIFAIGKRPSGDKDPYGLRRAALGVLRILIETPLRLDLRSVIVKSVGNQPVTQDQGEIETQLENFFGERLKAYLADRDISSDVFEAVAQLGLQDPVDFTARCHAVSEFLEAPAALSLCAAHKRVRNILKNSNNLPSLDESLLVETAEQDLHACITARNEETSQYLAKQHYSEALQNLARLQTPVDKFFETVLVMSDDSAVRENRLALLASLDELCARIADISRLSPE